MFLEGQTMYFETFPGLSKDWHFCAAATSGVLYVTMRHQRFFCATRDSFCATRNLTNLLLFTLCCNITAPTQVSLEASHVSQVSIDASTSIVSQLTQHVGAYPHPHTSLFESWMQWAGKFSADKSIWQIFRNFSICAKLGGLWSPNMEDR